MYGAILGDIIGSPFEFDRGNKSKEFELFTEGCGFTDDTVMTIAVAEALLNAGKEAGADTIREELVRAMKFWGKKYPNAGYGARFFWWLREKNPMPYNSFGNGSAMRVSAAGWLYDSLERTREVAVLTAEVSHNHPEGIKGAEAIASAIYLARNAATKQEISDYIIAEFGYDLSRTCDEIRPGYYHIETCQQTVPEAITAFLEGDSFEDVVRIAVSLGGDCDTLTDIAAAMAEAYYGIPAVLKAECRSRIPEEMNTVLRRFDIALGRKSETPEGNEEEEKNHLLVEMIEAFTDDPSTELLVQIMTYIHHRISEDGQCYVAAAAKFDLGEFFDVTKLQGGDTVVSDQDLRFKLCTVTSDEGNEFLGVYTSPQEAYNDPAGNTVFNQGLKETMDAVMSWDDLAGIVINPFGRHFVLTKELIGMLLELDAEERKCRNDKN